MDYAHLRDWYLARLRKRIHDRREQEKLTPSALIAADRKAVERLVLGAHRKQQQPLPTLPPPRFEQSGFKWTLMAFPVFLSLATLFSAALFRPGVIDLSTVLSAAATGFLGSFILYVLYRVAIVERLAALNQALNSSLSPAESEPCVGGGISELEARTMSLLEALRASSEREHAIADYALDFFCAVDADGRIAAASPSAPEFWGYLPQQLIGVKFLDLVFEDYKELTENVLKKTRTTASGASQFENVMFGQDEKPIDVRWVMEWSSTQLCLFCSATDISHQKQLQRLRDEFVRMVSHDLKTPLTSFGCALELISSNIYGDISERGQQLLANTRGDLTRLLRLVEDLLELEKLESKKFPIKQQPISLSSILQDAASSVNSLARRQQVTIDCRATDAVVLADGSRVTQVVINLLSNAIKYSPENSLVIMGADEPAGDFVRIYVSDEGPGIEKEFQQKIFEEFRQSRESDKKLGTGLGLFIARAIVEAHDGTIGVESKTDGKTGSTFWFTLPLSPD